MSTKNECCKECANSGEGHYYNPTRILACPCHSPKPTESLDEFQKKLDATVRELDVKDWVERTTVLVAELLHSQREELCGRLEVLKRKGFVETNRYSEVQQEIAWYNDGIRDAIQAIKNND